VSFLFTIECINTLLMDRMLYISYLNIYRRGEILLYDVVLVR
jgi:hypothetical protein